MPQKPKPKTARPAKQVNAAEARELQRKELKRRLRVTREISALERRLRREIVKADRSLLLFVRTIIARADSEEIAREVLPSPIADSPAPETPDYVDGVGLRRCGRCMSVRRERNLEGEIRGGEPLEPAIREGELAAVSE